MPKNGFKSITVSDDVYAELEAAYKKHERTLWQHGISSKSGFFTWLAFQSLKKLEPPALLWDSSK